MFEIEIEYENKFYKLEYEFIPGRVYLQRSFDPPDPPDPPECDVASIFVWDDDSEEEYQITDVKELERLSELFFDRMVEHAQDHGGYF